MQPISCLSFEFSRYAGGVIPRLFKDELQIVLTRCLHKLPVMRAVVERALETSAAFDGKTVSY